MEIEDSIYKLEQTENRKGKRNMNEALIINVANTLKITKKQVQVVLELLEEGNTIPFIARYRKERTNALTEDVIRSIEEVYRYQKNLQERKDDVLRLLAEKGMLTAQIQEDIQNAKKLVEVEDLYRPYKEKKKTKAQDAIQKGLEPLAKMYMAFPLEGNLEQMATRFVGGNVKTKEEAMEGARDIIAEWISDSAFCRKWVRKFYYQTGRIASKKKKTQEDVEKIYEMYYQYEEPIKDIKPHRVLAINRGEKEGVLSVSLLVEKASIVAFFQKKWIKNEKSFVTPLVLSAIEESLKRLIVPSVEREIRKDLKEKAEESAISNFSKNLEQLLLTPPIKGKVVLGLDPAYRTGCKLAVLDQTGKVLEIAVIYPHAPKNAWEEAKKKVLELIETYKIELIAIGNGTASRESETFIAEVIQDASHPVSYLLVSEAGASVYSASPLAIEEFPNLTVEKRSAISIGRRVQDSLAELVKIEPKSIGVGLYQHDISSKKLDESLAFVVKKAVNQVGVNVNTASRSLLSYVSGLSKKVIDEILRVRDLKGNFKTRKDLLKLNGMTPKVYEQSIGFLRILEGEDPLDKTAIHPESYSKVEQLLQKINLTKDAIGTEKIKDALEKVSREELESACGLDIYTLEDILSALENPGRDPRDMLPKPLLKSTLLKLEDLKVGDELQGTVRNIVDFGLFIDIGLKNDGLAHISRLSKTYLRHPSEQFKVGDIVTCYVEDISLEKKKVSLSLLPLEEVK